MFKNTIKKTGAQLRRATLPLTGFWDLLAELKEQASRTDALLNKIVELDAKVAAQDAVLAALLQTTQGIAKTVSDTAIGEIRAFASKENDRLDDYFAYQRSVIDNELHSSKKPFLYLGRHLNAVMRLSSGAFVVIPTDESGLLAYVASHGTDAIEPGVGRLISSRLQPGGTAIDCGGNIGIHTINMATAVGPQGKVICFEPLPHLAEAIRKSLLINGYSSFVHVEEAAVSDAVGSATFNAAAHSPVSSLFSLDTGVVADTQPVSITNLDAFIPAGERIDLIKLDIEGAEPLAWRGMQRVVNDNPNIEIVMEWSSSHFNRSGKSAAELMNELRAAGFSAFVIQDCPGGTPRPISEEEISTSDGANLFFTRRTID